ncbi:MAG: DUF2207 domain-containing protein [Clostridia bacterium]|nr:DUF2207 domain-containing protein [Clostridia bacterium]
MSINSKLKFSDKIILIIGLILLICPIFFSSTSNYADLTPDPFTDPNIAIQNLTVDVSFDENGKATISNTFDVTFLEKGLSEVLYSIPYVGKISEMTESGNVVKTDYLARVSNYSITRPGVENIKEYLNVYTDEVTGLVTFGIKRTTRYNLGETVKFNLKFDYDVLLNGKDSINDIYLNIIGGGNSMKIENITINVSYPKDVDFSANVPYIYKGAYGSTDKVSVNVIDNRNISVSIVELPEFEYVTIKQDMPDNYFKQTSIFPTFKVVAIVLTLLVAIIVLAVKLINGQVREVITPVEVTSFDEITPEQAEVFAKLKMSEKSISALIVYFASRGYLKIVEQEDETIKLVKKNNFDDDKYPHLSKFFKSIFVDANIVKITKTESADSKTKDAKPAQEEVVTEINTTVSELCKKEEFYKTFVKLKEKTIETKSKECYVKPSYKRVNLVNYLLLIPLLFNTACLMFVESITKLGFVSNSFSALLINNKFFIYTILNILCVVIAMLFNRPKFTDDFAMARGRVLGFKKYIEMVEKDRIKLLVKDNPSLFYDCLPYAYVLGVSDAWINNFKDLEIPRPEWFETYDDSVYNVLIFNHMFYSLNHSVAINLMAAKFKQMQETSSGFRSGSGGGISFGGFSGGGFAGGGAGGGSFGAR